MIKGDVTRPSDVEKAMHGCEFVFHCAYGSDQDAKIQRLVNVEGTRNVLEAAIRAKVKRVVHLSTIMVYGITSDGDCYETNPRRYCGNVYADSKLDAEKLCLSYARDHGCPVVILQLTSVYGPFAPVWTTNVLNRLKRERLILVNGGNGICNLVYVDDAVSAIMQSAVRENIAGEALIISGASYITWRKFYHRYECMLGISGNGTVSMSADEAKRYYYSIKQRNILRRIARSVLPEQIRTPLKNAFMKNSIDAQQSTLAKSKKPIIPLEPFQIKFYATETRMHIEKAKRMLGYQPAFDIDSGMRLTEQWARWANLLNV
jgi:nucleoside-diphosphate-sugar epimerase